MVKLTEIIEQNMPLLGLPIVSETTLMDQIEGEDREYVEQTVAAYLFAADSETRQESKAMLGDYFDNQNLSFVVTYHPEDCRRDIFLRMSGSPKVMYVGSSSINDDKPTLRLVYSR